MRRACGLAILICAAMGFLCPRGAGAAGFDFVNGIGLIDYASHPKLKVGSWVRYHMTGRSEMGASDDYMVTVVIAGEERFWGEDCFWVETWTEPKNKPPLAVAALMSSAIFSDSLPNLRNQYYMRKSVDALNPDGTAAEQVVRRPASTLKKRNTILEIPNVQLDTLGIDTVKVATGTYVCRKVSWKEGKAATVDQRDSSITTEVRENRMSYFSHEIPVTGLVRENMEYTIKRRTWAIGRSQEASPYNVMDRSTGEAQLVGFGEGMKSRLFPESRQKSLRELDAAASRPPARPAAARRKH